MNIEEIKQQADEIFRSVSSESQTSLDLALDFAIAEATAQLQKDLLEKCAENNRITETYLQMCDWILTEAEVLHSAHTHRVRR